MYVGKLYNAVILKPYHISIDSATKHLSTEHDESFCALIDRNGNRVGAAKIAIEQAGERSVGSVLGLDAFFPMGDTVEAAAKAGVTAIIQPGGSIKDQVSIDKANEYGMAMVFTGVRHFKH